MIALIAGQRSGAVLREAFPDNIALLEEYIDEDTMVANLTAQRDPSGVPNSYGIVFHSADDGLLSYTLRFPVWQEGFDKRISVTDGNATYPYWLRGSHSLFLFFVRCAM